MKLISFSAIVMTTFFLQTSCNSPKKLSEFDYTEEEKANYVEKEDEQNTYYNDNEIRYADYIYFDEIKTDQLFVTGQELSSPIIGLNSGETITLSFDDLGNEVEDYYYKVIHCDARWQPSDMLENQYIEGFFSDAITNYDFSFNTLTSYVHYELQFPNQGMRPKVSGNYVLLVMRDNEEDQPILSKRFMVYENKVAIVPRVRRAASVQDRNTKQQVDFEIHHASFPIVNPQRDLDVVVRQNERWDNALYDLKPVFIKNKILEFQSPFKNSFFGGNEYRFFNFRSIRYQTNQIESIEQKDDGLHVWLKPFGKRNQPVYTSTFDINGGYEIRSYDAFDHVLEGDYAKVHFTLPYPEPITNGNVYVMGKFSNRTTHPSNQMYYNDQLQQYEATITMKQGYYDYQYVVRKDGEDVIDNSEIEGSYFETENRYDILVYFKDLSDDYQRLIGVTVFMTDDF